jgi:hypothetical protein
MMSSRWASKAVFSLRSALAWRVSFPCWVLASAMFSLPFSVLGPVDRPPWNWHFCVRLVLSAGFLHCSPLRFDFAVQRLQVIFPAAVTSTEISFFVIIKIPPQHPFKRRQCANRRLGRGNLPDGF